MEKARFALIGLIAGTLLGAAARTGPAPSQAAEPHDRWTPYHAAVTARAQDEEAAPTF
jgi:hypothetical protein